MIGVADDYRGEVPKAFIKLKHGQSLDVEALRDFLQDKLSLMEMPRQVEFRDELPKTIIGKLSKKELVAEEKAKRRNSPPAQQEESLASDVPPS